jgi:hypothetical protein
MTAAESITMAEAAYLEIYPPVTEIMRLAGTRDSRLGTDVVTRTARLAVAAWAAAVDGDDAMITAIAQPDAAYFVMHPAKESWRVAKGPKVTRIKITGLDADAEPPELRVGFEFAGRLPIEDSCQAGAGRDTQFVGFLTFTLRDAGQWPWQLTSGHAATLDEFLGYVFTVRRESPEEYRQRASPASGTAAGTAPTGPLRAFRLVAGFAEHDERLGSSVSIELHRETAPTRAEAEQLVWPAIWDETGRALGDGDWHPSLIWLDLIELLDQQPRAELPRPGSCRLSTTSEPDQAALLSGFAATPS